MQWRLYKVHHNCYLSSSSPDKIILPYKPLTKGGKGPRPTSTQTVVEFNSLQQQWADFLQYLLYYMSVFFMVAGVLCQADLGKKKEEDELRMQVNRKTNEVEQGEKEWPLSAGLRECFGWFRKRLILKVERTVFIWDSWLWDSCNCEILGVCSLFKI